MADTAPPPLPSAETALATYLKAGATILPALLIGIFSNAFLLPRLQWLWRETHLNGSQAQWIMDASSFLGHSMQFVFGAIVLLFGALELGVRTWPRYRRAVVSVVTVLFHTTVLLSLAAISTSVLLAAPILTRNKDGASVVRPSTDSRMSKKAKQSPASTSASSEPSTQALAKTKPAPEAPTKISPSGLPVIRRQEIDGLTPGKVAEYFYQRVLTAAQRGTTDWDQTEDRLRHMPQHWRMIFTLCWLQAEVDNGGHEQFFDNGQHRLDDVTEADLSFLRATRFLALFTEARRLDGRAPADRRERVPEMEPLDDAFYKEKKDLHTLVGGYVLSHLADYGVE